MKYAADGTRQWARQFGTPYADYATAVAADPTGNILVAGWSGSHESIGANGLVIKYAPNGSERWRRALASPGDRHDVVTGVATDADGNIAVVGYTDGVLRGSNQGIIDTFVAFYSPTGTLKWIRQPGRLDFDGAQGVRSIPPGRSSLSAISPARPVRMKAI